MRLKNGILYSLAWVGLLGFIPTVEGKDIDNFKEFKSYMNRRDDIRLTAALKATESVGSVLSVQNVNRIFDGNGFILDGNGYEGFKLRGGQIISFIGFDTQGAGLYGFTSFYNGGAIYNEEGLVPLIRAYFTNNTAQYGNGGAIYNSKNGVIKNLSGRFIGNKVDKYGNGGAIYNQGEITITADLENTEFTGNTAKGEANAVYSYGGTVNLNPGAFKIIFNDPITGDKDHKGTININDPAKYASSGGIVELNAPLSSQSVNLYGGGLVLGSAGNFASDVTFKAYGGTFDIGTNTVTAESFSFGSGSTLALTISDRQSFGKLISDHVTIDTNATTLSVVMNKDVLEKGETETFQIISSRPTGYFSALKQNARYDVKDNRDGTVTVTGTASAVDVVVEAGGKLTHGYTAEAWDSVDSSANGKEGEVSRILASLSNNAVNAAGKQAYINALTAVAPETRPTVMTTSSEHALKVMNIAVERFWNAETDALTGRNGGDEIGKAKIWIQGLNSYGKLNAPNGYVAHAAGFAAGMETSLSDDFKLGIGYSHSETDIDGFFRQTQVRTNGGFIYGEYRPNRFYVNFAGYYDRGEYEEDKYVHTSLVEADYNANTLTAQVTAGYAAGVFRPEAGFRYVNVRQGKYSDTAGQTVLRTSYDIVTGVLGVRAVKMFGAEGYPPVRIDARVAAAYDIQSAKAGNVVLLTNGSSYVTTGSNLERISYEFGTRASIRVDDRTEIRLGYEGRYRDDYRDHTGMISLLYEF